MVRSFQAALAACASLLLASTVRATPLDCTSVPPGAPPVTIEILTAVESGDQDLCVAEVRGMVDLSRSGGWDVYVIVDSSGSTAGSSGIDLDGDGLTSTGDWRAPTDPGDS